MRLLRERNHYHLFKLRRDTRNFLAQRPGRSHHMLNGNLGKRPLKGAFARQPFVNDDSQGVLIAGWLRVTLELLGRHVGYRANDIPRQLAARILGLGHRGNTEIAEQDLVIASQQHILWLNIAMDHFLIMSILQGIGHLFDVGNDMSDWHPRTPWVWIACSAIWRIIHNQKRGALRYIVIENPDYVRM